jgi:hypothetical protein
VNPVKSKTATTSNPSPKAGRTRRAARQALLAVSLTAAQLGMTETALGERMFNRELLDRLKPPLTRYHE